MPAKVLYFLFTLLIFSACNSGPEVSESPEKILPLSAPNKIVGDWVISATQARGMKSHCCACPKINFYGSGKAVMTFPDNANGHYDWSISSDTLTLQSTDAGNTFPFFCHLKYKMAYADKKRGRELTLSADSMIYILSR